MPVLYCHVPHKTWPADAGQHSSCDKECVLHKEKARETCLTLWYVEVDPTALLCLCCMQERQQLWLADWAWQEHEAGWHTALDTAVDAVTVVVVESSSCLDPRCAVLQLQWDTVVVELGSSSY